MLKEIKSNLKELGFNNNEIKAYVALTRLGEGTAAQVAKKSDLPRTTAISILDKLKESCFITDHIYKGKTYYWVESPKVISDVFEKRVEVAQSLNSLLGGLYRTEAHFPAVQVFDTKKSIKNFIEKFLANLEKKSVLYTIDSPGAKNYARVYFDDVNHTTIRQKKKKGILTQSLIPCGSFSSIEEYRLRDQVIKIREMPEAVKFEASIWIGGNMIVHFSGNPLFLVTIKHDAVYKSVKSIYDFLWNISVPKN